MTKEELIKLSRENLRKSKQGSLCECYDEAFVKGYELSKKHITELELKIKHLTKHLEPQSMTSLFEQVEEEVKQEQKVKELEKENTELKAKVTALENANKAMVKELDDMGSGGISFLKNIVRSKEEIDKAKKIIKRYVKIYVNPYPEEEIELRNEAEQFLKEVSE